MAVTVVIPAYRSETTIARALTHLLAQPVARIIVCLNGEPDDTARIAHAFADPRIEVVTYHGAGAQGARNLGLAMVETETVMFHDADDYVEGDIVAGLTTALAGADVAFAPMAIEQRAWRTGELGRGKPFRPRYRSGADLFWRWFVTREYVIPAATLWRTDFLRAIGAWDETIARCQDGELTMRAALRGARVANARSGVALYVRDNRDSVSSRPHDPQTFLRIIDKALSIETSVISAAAKRQGVARHAYGIAWDCFRRGEDVLGRTALRRARELGFHGHLGPWHHRIAAHGIGLRAKTALIERIKALR